MTFIFKILRHVTLNIRSEDHDSHKGTTLTFNARSMLSISVLVNFSSKTLSTVLQCKQVQALFICCLGTFHQSINSYPVVMLFEMRMLQTLHEKLDTSTFEKAYFLLYK